MKKSAMMSLVLFAVVGVSGTGLSFGNSSGFSFEAQHGVTGSKISFGRDFGAPLSYRGNGWCSDHWKSRDGRELGDSQDSNGVFGAISTDCLSDGLTEPAFVLGSEAPPPKDRSTSMGTFTARGNISGYELLSGGDDDEITHVFGRKFIGRGSGSLKSTDNDNLLAVGGPSSNPPAESSAVPEPSVLLIILAGLVMLFVSEQVRRRAGYAPARNK